MSESRGSNHLFFTVHYAESFIHEMASHITLVSKSVNNKFPVWLHVQQLQKKMLPTWLLNFSIWHLMTGSDLVNDLKKKPPGIPRIINQIWHFYKSILEEGNCKQFLPCCQKITWAWSMKDIFLLPNGNNSHFPYNIWLCCCFCHRAISSIPRVNTVSFLPLLWDPTQNHVLILSPTSVPWRNEQDQYNDHPWCL